jgi:hypothetical protein
MVAMDKNRMKGNEPRIMVQALNHYDIKITKPVVLYMQHPVSEKYQHMSTAIGDYNPFLHCVDDVGDIKLRKH